MSRKAKTAVQDPSSASNAPVPTGILHQLPVDELMKRSYLNYAVSVITSRALPDARDGLKPVHRRILMSMHNLNMTPSRPYVKSARMVGDTIGKLHPHGDTAVYDAAVKMAQPWGRRITLVDGQGNFGSIDGDSPAAYRYTEMRMTRAAHSFFDDIDHEVVNFTPNFDGSTTEPEVLPVSYPNIWVNGTDGIAVGMATEVLPHNANETIDALLAWMKNRDITIDEIVDIMPGPDFPTGGLVQDLDGYKDALRTGKGRVRLRAKYFLEKPKRSQNQLLVINELPFKVNKAELHKKITELVKDKVLEDVVNVTDESSKGEIRLVLELRKGCYPEVVFNQVLAQTEAETTFNYNMMLLDKKTPRLFTLLDIFDRFYSFRVEVVTRRIQYLLRQEQAKAHRLRGYIAALSRLDETLDLIRNDKSPEGPSNKLQEFLGIDEVQAGQILGLQLRSLTALQIEEIRKQYDSVVAIVADYEDILQKSERVEAIIVAELEDAKKRFGSPRLTEISYENTSITMADLVKKEPCLVHLTHGGYIKRMAANEINTQNRYTQGKSGMITGDDDYVQSVYSGSTHDLVMLFSEAGLVRAKRAWLIPEGSSAQKGRHIRNLFDDFADKIQTCLFVPSLEEEGVYLVTVTEKGKIKRTSLAEYSGSLRRNGLQALNVEEGDKFLTAAVCREHDHIMLGLSDGRVIRFDVNDEQLRSTGRLTAGVRGVKLIDDAKVLSLMVVPGNGQPCPTKEVEVEREVDGQLTKVTVTVTDTSEMDNGRFLLCVGKNGVGKRTPIDDYAPQNRAGQGVMGFNINKKTGDLLCMHLVTLDNDIVLTTQSKTNRIHVGQIRQAGRITAGSYIMDTAGDIVMDVTTVPGSASEALAAEVEGKAA